MGDVTEDSLFMAGEPPRRRGRPPAEEPSSTISVWLFSRHHDRLVQAAKARDVSVSSLVREMLVKAYPGLDKK